MNDEELDELDWLVLVNAAGEHSLWPAAMPVPEGWRETGPEGDRATCLAWIDTHWTAMRRTPP
jgi:MbtH protein